VTAGSGGPAPGRPLRLAHRGDWRAAPENTVAAFLAALRVPGCDGLEFDVNTSADGVPVILHDDTLARVQGHDAAVGSLSASELERFGIPRLEVVLAAVGRRPFLDVELKGRPPDSTVDLLEAARGHDLERAAVSSFDATTLAWLRTVRPNWPRWLNSEDLDSATVSLATALGCSAISVDWRAITPAGLRRLRAAGLDLAAWTVRRRSTWARLARLGVIAACVEAAALDG
jgi:glycerophosphoryl diester phosphodiesterase